MKTPTPRKAFENWRQLLICVVCTIAFGMVGGAILRLLAHSGSIAARPYWWGAAAEGHLVWSLGTGLAASLIGSLHETAGYSQLSNLGARMWLVLIATVPAVCVAGLLSFIGAALDPKAKGLPDNIGLLTSVLSLTCMLLLSYASAFAGAARMRPIAAYAASVRFIKSCLGAGLILFYFAVTAAASVALFRWTGHATAVFCGQVVANVLVVIVAARVWNVSEQISSASVN